MKKNLLSCFILSCAILLFPIRSFAETITVGIVKDGPSYFDDVITAIEEELNKHLGDTQTVRFKHADAFNAKWQKNKAGAAIQAALNDSEVDYILLTGPFATLDLLSSKRKLTKPVLSSYVQLASVLGPTEEEQDQKKIENANFIYIPDRVLRDVETFNDMVGFGRMHILVSSIDKDFLKFVKNLVPKYEEKTGIQMEVIAVSSDDLEGSLSALNNSQAVYITYMPQLTLSQREQMIQIINGYKVPSFSMFGHSDVRLGALAAQTPDMMKQLVRRTALNISELIRGTDVNDLSAILPVDTSLMINGKTASLINFVPDLETQISATIIRSEFIDQAGGNLTLEQAFRLAEKGNTELSIKDSDVETSRQNKNISMSDLFPQIRTDVTYERIDGDRARTLSTLSQELTTGGVSVSQVLFDDETFSDFRSSIKRFEGSQEDREVSRLDAVTNGGVSYLQYSLARELYRIEMDNLRVTEDNLELAKLRYNVGQSGKEEVFRWQAELYQRKQSLFASKANVEAQRIAFNQVIGEDQQKRWQPIRIDVDPEEFSFVGGKVRSIVKKKHAQKEKIRSFLVNFALEQAPEVQFLEKNKEAKKIELNQLKRGFALPTVTANFDYSDEINRAGGARLAGLDDDEYTVSISASYPLFEGGSKYFEVKRAKSEHESLDKQIKLAEEIVEQRTRTSIRNIESSFPSIKFSLLAAESARKNLDIVQEKYAQGTVNVTDLLEAQNQSFVSDQDAAIALYTHLNDFVVFQRSISWFETEQSEDQKKSFVDNLNRYIAASRK